MSRKFLALCVLVGLSVSLPAGATYNNANIPAVSSLAALRLLPAVQYQTAYMTQYSAVTGQGGGEFVYNGLSTCSDNGGTLIQAVGGCYSRITNGQPYNTTWFGQQGGGKQVYDGVSSVSGGLTHTIISASAKWTTSMVGWHIDVNGAGSSGHQVDSTIVSVTPPGTLTYAATTATAGTGLTVSVYPDDSAAITSTVNAAGAAGVGIIFPSGETIGAANNGTAAQFEVTSPDVWLNSATLWLGQTGPTSDTGWSFNMEGVNYSGSNWTGVRLHGPGTVDGLYQTNQGIAQNSIADAFIWNDGGGAVIQSASVTGPITIQNTKGVAITAEGVNNFSISTGVLTQNCGDFAYQHSATPGDMTGRPMCVTVEFPTGSLIIDGLTSNNAAQSGLLIQNATLGGPRNFDAEISNCSFTGNGYYGFDAEQFAGIVHLANCSNVSNGVSPTGATILGGFQMRDLAHFSAVNINSLLTDSDAFVLQATDGTIDLEDWDVKSLSVIGSAASHAGNVTIAWQANGAGRPQRITIDGMNYDTAVFQYSGPQCVSTNPYFQVFTFNDIHASTQYTGMGNQTVFEPSANVNTFTYIKGTNSSLNTVGIAASPGTFKGSTLFDWPNVFTNGAPAVTGIISADYGPTSISQPLTSFTCPS